MFIDGRATPNGRVIRSDVCLIGAGAAGITLALTLAKRGVDVVLVESGGLEFDRATQQLYDGEVIDNDYPPPGSSRLRYLGGTTNHWGGACRPLDPHEFEERGWVPHSGWPIRSSDVEPYYDATREMLSLPEPHFRFDAGETGSSDHVPLFAPGSKANADFEPVVWRRTKPGPLRMRSTYAQALRTTKHLRCVLHANITALIPNQDRNAIVRARAATLDGRRFAFEAKSFVLCAGAIENARMLLLSDQKVPGGVGNQHGLVGRYFADHGSIDLGEIHFFDSAPVIREESYAKSKFAPAKPELGDIVGFAASAAARERDRLLGFSMMCFPTRMSRTPKSIQSLSTPAGDARNPDPQRLSRVMRLVGVFEKSPNPESRVSLDTRTDALGLRKILVDLNVQQHDRSSALAHAKRFATQVARSGYGRVRLTSLEDFPWTPMAGHHAGTARMADDPKRGVTDRDGRVHGTANLYVTGGALFPTVGWQNPTFSIVALALRLADTLSKSDR